MKLVVKIAAGIVLAFVLLIAGCSALIASSSDDIDRTLAGATATGESSDDSFPGETAAQQNAREQAESYLDTAPFSRSGLIKQLKYEGYSVADATYAVEAVDPDWNEQAARQAQSYLDTSSFSRSGLIKQLRYEGFSQAQALYGVNAVGL